MGTSGRVTHGALHSPLLLVFMTVALLAGSSCSHRVLSQIPGINLFTISVPNNLAVPAVVTVTTGSPSSSVSVTVPAGQTGQIVLNILQVIEGLLNSKITVAAGGVVYTIPENLLQEILGDLLGVSITLSACPNSEPGLSVTVTIADKPPTTVCVAPPPSPPPPPTFPPPPSPSPPPPSPSPRAPSPSPPPPSPSPPPPSPSPLSPVSSPAPSPVNVIVVIELNVTNILPVNLTITVTATTGSLTYVITAVITPGGSQLITLLPGSLVVSVTITPGSSPTSTLPSTVLQTIQGDLSSTGLALLEVSTCPTNAAKVLITVAANVQALAAAVAAVLGVCVAL